MAVKLNDDDFQKSLIKLRGGLSKVLERAMKDSITQLKDESEKLAPFKTGDLVDSVDTQVRSLGNTVIGTIQYNVPYAAGQHNDMSLRPGPGTKGKPSTRFGKPGPNYLQNPGKGLGTAGEYHKKIQAEWRKA